MRKCCRRHGQELEQQLGCLALHPWQYPLLISCTVRLTCRMVMVREGPLIRFYFFFLRGSPCFSGCICSLVEANYCVFLQNWQLRHFADSFFFWWCTILCSRRHVNAGNKEAIDHNSSGLVWDSAYLLCSHGPYAIPRNAAANVTLGAIPRGTCKWDDDAIESPLGLPPHEVCPAVHIFCPIGTSIMGGCFVQADGFISTRM